LKESVDLEAEAMNIVLLVSGIVGMALLVYLFYVLFNGEKI